VVEIYTRLLTGPVVKSDAKQRKRYLENAPWSLEAKTLQGAASSEDAFDAAVSALVMDEHAEALSSLVRALDPITLLEGRMWAPSAR
jgi:hypothetical protein